MGNRNTQKDLQTEEWIKRANDGELSLEAIFKIFSMKEAKEAYDAALRVKDFVLEKIK